MKDMLNREISVANWVAYGLREGNTGGLGFGFVTKVSEHDAIVAGYKRSRLSKITSPERTLIISPDLIPVPTRMGILKLGNDRLRKGGSS